MLASAALMATSEQEQRVKDALVSHGFEEYPAGEIKTIADAPDVGHFFVESLFGSRKADIVFRLWDRRVLPIECKVSNSETNSIKRPTVLSGVYNLRHLEQAQDAGLTLFWAHDLGSLLY